MTVCIAAICEGSRIVCVSDRMLTMKGPWDGDWQYEPLSPKVVHLGGPFALMFAGDPDTATEVIGCLRPMMAAGSPQTTEAVAKLYTRAYAEVRETHAHAAHISPEQVTVADLRRGNHPFTPRVAKSLLAKVDAFCLSDLSVVIGGIDPDGVAHLRESNGGADTSSLDGRGFAVLGSGYDPAYARMMHAQYSPRMSRSEAIIYAYDAKKKSDELVNTVGGKTDVFVLSGEDAPFQRLDDSQLQELDLFYRRWTAYDLFALGSAIQTVHGVFGGPSPVLRAETQVFASQASMTAVSVAISSAFQPTPPQPAPAKAPQSPPGSKHGP